MRSLKILFTLSLAGLLFSGYLSAVKLFTKTCAFGESCPLFLGYPACWYGFVMYLAMTALIILGLTGKMTHRATVKATSFISCLGIIFAGNLVLQEIVKDTITGTLGLSTCAYGLIFYVLIFTLSLKALKNTRVN